MFILSYLSAMCAILLLWFVYPKEFDFGEAAGDSLLFYDAQRVGQLPADNPIPWRSDSLLYEKSTEFGFPDLTGGWLNGGEIGAYCVCSRTWHDHARWLHADCRLSGARFAHCSASVRTQSVKLGIAPKQHLLLHLLEQHLHRASPRINVLTCTCYQEHQARQVALMLSCSHAHLHTTCLPRPNFSVNDDADELMCLVLQAM